MAICQFLTECAALENMMWGLAIVCQNKPLEEIRREFLEITFGQAINALKKSIHLSPTTIRIGSWTSG
jgi:hypothetical protein